MRTPSPPLPQRGALLGEDKHAGTKTTLGTQSQRAEPRRTHASRCPRPYAAPHTCRQLPLTHTRAHTHTYTHTHSCSLHPTPHARGHCSAPIHAGSPLYAGCSEASRGAGHCSNGGDRPEPAAARPVLTPAQPPVPLLPGDLTGSFPRPVAHGR